MYPDAEVIAIMPCRGRADQTIANVQRLVDTTGINPYLWQLRLVIDANDEAAEAIGGLRRTGPYGPYVLYGERPTYWQALGLATEQEPHGPLIATLANDLWACDGWLATAVEEYQHHFGDGPGLLGFAGDGHGEQHSCHFLISRALLDRYGGWPIWYHHNFGDAELCARAQADRLYAKAERAYLEHCHVERGLAPDDAVYQAGRANYKKDEALFVERRRLGWPLVSR